MALYLVGAGLTPAHLTLRGLEVLKACQAVYADGYTSAFSEGSWQDLARLVGKRVRVLGRRDLEPATALLRQARTLHVALLVAGDPFFATTHHQIVSDARAAGVKVESVPGVSVLAAAGRSGLSLYRFGGATSIPFWQKSFRPASFYDAIRRNRRAGLHTLCLLDRKGRRAMTVQQALAILERAEKKRGGRVLQTCTLVALGRLASRREAIAAGGLEKVRRARVGTPAALVVCAALNEKEKEFLRPWMH